MVRNCLESYLGESACDLLLMLVLTMALSSITPTVLPGKHEFEVGALKDASLFVANLATRILWFLRPNHFTIASSNSIVLFITKMTKKIEHKGINN